MTTSEFLLTLDAEELLFWLSSSHSCQSTKAEAMHKVWTSDWLLAESILLLALLSVCYIFFSRDRVSVVLLFVCVVVHLCD